MSMFIDFQDAQTQLPGLLERVQAGEEITITKAGRPIAKLTAFHERPGRRLPGDDRVTIHANFDDPIPEWDPDYMHPEDPMRDVLR